MTAATTEPKTRGRGARVQHVAIDLEPLFASFVDKVWGPLRPSTPLFPGSPGVFRRRWDSLLSALEVPPRYKLTPGSLRGGGAVAAYWKKPVADIQWTSVFRTRLPSPTISRRCRPSRCSRSSLLRPERTFLRLRR